MYVTGATIPSQLRQALPSLPGLDERRNSLGELSTRQDRRMRVEVDMDKCESNALCMGYAPEVFEVDDDDNLIVLNKNPSEDLREKVLLSVRMCPKQAISVFE
jgi:ferredoxin